MHNASCWLCNENDGEMFFSFEFDCFVHQHCLEYEPEDNREAVIMRRELGFEYKEIK